ncbi:MAG: class I SAM-dependent methyltransferase, partial [Promethearchaeota archaeon]
MRLNVGCGKKYEPEYSNIDLFEDLIADKLMSAINLDFEDYCCEEVKAIQIIEHLTFFEAIYALNEFFRVLKLKGK